MKPKIYWLLFSFIIVVAAIIRFYRLGDVPHGMTWDEAAIGYNGYAIWKTHRDEWLVRTPVSFQSFGDYKAPLAIYVNGLFTALFGMNLWAVRLPFALASLVAIAGFMLLVRKLGTQYYPSSVANSVSLIAGTLITLSPWHIHFSRAGFESGMALAFLLIGLWLLMRLLFAVHDRLWWRQLGLTALSVLCLVAAIYTYHSSKIVVPLLVITIMLLHIRDAWRHKLVLIIGALLAIGLLVPLAIDAFLGQGLQRLSSSILDNYQGVTLLSHIGSNLLVHLSPAFLIAGASTTLRHGGGGWGVLYPTTLFLDVCGLALYGYYSLFARKKLHKDAPLFVLSMVWIIIGLLPAAIGEEIPHSNRALLALPGFLLLAVLGGKYLLELVARSPFNRQVLGTHHEANQVMKAVAGSLIVAHAFFAISFIHYYFTDFARNSADAFKDGYLEAFAYVQPYENKVDKILFTSEYGQPYIYALFVRKTNPIWYQGGSLVKYEFNDHINRGDIDRSNTVVVSGNNPDLPTERADNVIYGSDGKIRFKIYLSHT